MKIACVGDNCIDYYDDSGQAFPGGNPVNVAVYAKRLGAESAYLGAVGTDHYGDLLLSRLREKGVDTSHVQCLPGATALCHVTHMNGDRILGDYDEGVMADFSLRPKLVVATRGGQGSLAYDGSHFAACPPTPCKLIDTMGAGDSYIAGFLLAWLDGCSLDSCMHAGAKNAAITIGYAGAW